MQQLKIENLAISYGGRQVLSEVSLCVNRGDWLFVLGENGSGKTTLIKGLLGLLPKNSGSINFLGGITPSDIGYLPQSTAMQKSFPATAEEIVLSGTLHHKKLIGFYTKADKTAAEAVMKRLGILEIKNAPFSGLSGGQQQRVLLCRALVAASKILVLDEPTSFLDAKTAEELYNILKDLQKSGITIIMISHDVHAATEYASHVLYLKHKPLFFGSKEDFKKGGFSELRGCSHGE